MDLDGPMDDMTSADSIADKDLGQVVNKQVKLKGRSPRRNSNMGKAKRIVNNVKMKKRSSNPVDSETPHQHNLGGHVSSFLNR